MSILLLRGYSKSGKDYIGQILCTKYNYKRFSFADSLKEVVSEKYKCPISLLHSQDGKSMICYSDPNKRSYRQILIDEALYYRSINPDIFAENCCKTILQSNSDKIIITDWRYENEISVINNTFPNYKIFPVHIINIFQDKSPVNDISEYQLINRKGDYTIINCMTEAIYEKVDNLICSIN
jgi:hypothetical protein